MKENVIFIGRDLNPYNDLRIKYMKVKRASGLPYFADDISEELDEGYAVVDQTNKGNWYRLTPEGIEQLKKELGYKTNAEKIKEEIKEIENIKNDDDITIFNKETLNSLNLNAPIKHYKLSLADAIRTKDFYSELGIIDAEAYSKLEKIKLESMFIYGNKDVNDYENYKNEYNEIEKTIKNISEQIDTFIHKRASETLEILEQYTKQDLKEINMLYKASIYYDSKSGNLGLIRNENPNIDNESKENNDCNKLLDFYEERFLKAVINDIKHWRDNLSLDEKEKMKEFKIDYLFKDDCLYGERQGRGEQGQLRREFNDRDFLRPAENIIPQNQNQSQESLGKNNSSDSKQGKMNALREQVNNIVKNKTNSPKDLSPKIDKER